MSAARVSGLVLLLAGGCLPVPAASYGEQLFHDPQFSGSQFNQWSCGTCHATSALDQRILPGASLANIVNRTSYFGGQEPDLRSAVSFCYVKFMRGPKELEPDEPRSRALYEYLATLGDAVSPTVPMTIPTQLPPLPRGDPTRGLAVYRAACRTCHGDRSTVRGRNSALASLLPNIAEHYVALFPGVDPALVFTEKVRHGQFFLVGGSMPFYPVEALSDDDLGALLGYLDP